MISKLFSSITRSSGLKMVNILPAYFSGKKITFSTECRQKILQGCDKLADAVQVTLGPKGRNVAIEQSFGVPKITKDGVTVAKAIDLTDKYENMGAQLVKQVASQTNDKAGDGTTTATVLARAIFREGCKKVAAGMNPMDLRKGIQLAVDRVVEDLKKRSKQVKTTEMIANVGTISANGDREIGGLIAKLMEKVGNHGTITVADGKTLHHEHEFVEGMKFDRGYISPYFVTNSKTQKVEFENAYILITDRKVTNLQSILQFLEHTMKENRPILIIAEDIESEALATLLLNKIRGGVKVCAVKAPAFGDNRKAILNDIAVLTGGTCISEDLGLTLEKSEVAVLGRAKTVIVTKDDTIIMHGAGSKKQIDERCDTIVQQLKETTSEYDKEKLQERLAKFRGGVGIIKVGGASEVEVGEVKDRITDALNATKAAVEEGIVVGGGCALLYASKSLNELKGENFDQDVGINIVKSAIQIPCKQIAENAGKEGSIILGKLLEQKDELVGYDAAEDKFVNMIEKGIIDPTKVVRSALIDASSVASLMITTECMIVEEEEEKKQMPRMPAGGMGGMGGMDGGY